MAACSEEHPDNLPGAANNPYPDVSVSAASTVAIDAADITMTYSIPVSFSRAAPADGELRFRAISGSALPDRDYQEVSGQIEFTEGQRQVNVPVTLLNDASRLSARDFRVELTGATHAHLSENVSHTVTIAPREENSDIEVEPTTLNTSQSLSLRMPTAERSPLSYPIVFTLSQPLRESATLEWRTVDDTAFAGAHYNAVEATGDEAIVLDAGDQELSFELALLHDATLNENLNFQLQLVSAEGLELPEDRLINIEVVNSNGPGLAVPAVSLPGEVIYHEPTEATDYQIYLPLSEAMPQGGSLRVSLIELTARDQIDFVAYTEIVEVPINSTEVRIPVRLLYNPEQTEDRDFRIELSGASNLTLPEQRNFNVRIVDTASTAPAPLLQLTPNLVRVPTPSNTMSPQDVTFYFELSEPLQSEANLTIRSRNGSAAAGVDFEEHGEVNRVISEGSEEIAVTVTLLPTTSTSERELELVFSQPQGLRLPESRSVTVQIDPRNTPAIPEVSVPAEAVVITAPEGPDSCVSNNQPDDFCHRRIVIPFTDLAPLRGTVQVSSQDRTAREGNEFTLFEDEVSFAMGDREAAILLHVEPASDPVVFELILQTATNLQLPDAYEERVLTVVIEPYS